jgi:hypothetical protein
MNKILNFKHEHWDWLTNWESMTTDHESQDVDLESAFGDHGWADTPSNTLDELLTIH